MLDYRLIDYKSTLTRNGNTYIDLMSKVWQNKVPKNGQIIIVNEYYVVPSLLLLGKEYFVLLLSL